MFKANRLEKQYKILLSWLKEKTFSKPLKLLEIGAGSMVMKQFLPKNIEYYSMDFGSGSDPALVGKKYDYLFNLDEGRMPIPDNSYDIIVCFETLEHSLSPKQVLKEIKRISRKDSLLFFSLPNEYNFVQRIYYLFGKKTFCDEPFELVEKHLHIHKPRVKDILNLVSSEFKILQVKYAWQSNKIPKFLENVIDSLAKIWPSLFSRIVVLKVKNNKRF